MKLQWLINGDFNLIYQAQDKNNNILNLNMMRQFKRAIDELNLNEMKLHGHNYIWRNDKAQSTMTRIDRFFYTTEWDMLFLAAHLSAHSSDGSDHSLLLLNGEALVHRYTSFQMDSFWVSLSGFQEIVQNTWQ